MRVQSVPSRGTSKASPQRVAIGAAKCSNGGLERQREGGNDSACEQQPQPDSEYSSDRQARAAGQPRQAATSTRSHQRRQTVVDSSSDSDQSHDGGSDSILIRARRAGQPGMSNSDSDFEAVNARPRRAAQKGAARKAARSSRRLMRSSASLGQRAEGSTHIGKGGQPVAKQRPQQGLVRSRRGTASLVEEQLDGGGQGGVEAWDEGAVEEALEVLERDSRSLQVGWCGLYVLCKFAGAGT